ncbi:hypothetical protein ACIQM4_07770 [Streptomyces sp. NPDC091272]|uniref:hypothetical protein n=1 Tax=Streptomyces sp. NPDC091272 TaxID=3365981 RepID=UPI003827BC70
MTQATVPHQPSDGRHARPGGRAPVDPALSEACRLLCVGVYRDGRFREEVIEELYVHEERVTAPSYGFDAARVLAHALRARRLELVWAAGMLALWALAVTLSEGLFLALLVPCVLLALAPLIRGSARRPEWARRVPALLVRWYGRGMFGYVLLWLVARATADPEAGSDGEQSWLDAVLEPFRSVFGWLVDPLGGLDLLDGYQPPRLAWLSLVFFAMLAFAVGARRRQFAYVLAEELKPARFQDRAQDRAEDAEGFTGQRAQRMRQLVAVEQESPLIMYGVADPFCGAGRPVQTWELAVELRPREDAVQQTVDNRMILDRIRPLLEALRVPSAHGDAVRDRLRELSVDECVFMPAVDAPPCAQTQGDPGFVRGSLAAAVEEGGETRRHFLRIRVGGWGEEVVVTVFVRVHTQGGMLMLEIAPHVLSPVRRQFRVAERSARRYLDSGVPGRIAGALASTPATPVRALVTLVRGLIGGWQLLTDRDDEELRDGPDLSVRELGAAPHFSLFQDMDVSRYLKSMQDRVAGGVKEALHAAGWQTGEFEQKVINVSNGGVVIGSVTNSAVGVGAGAHAATTNTAGQHGNPGGHSPTATGPAGPAQGGNGNGRN